MCLARKTLPNAPLPKVEIMSKLEKVTLLLFVISFNSLVSSYFFDAFPFLILSFFDSWGSYVLLSYSEGFLCCFYCFEAVYDPFLLLA
jgi:hypothetical protein